MARTEMASCVASFLGPSACCPRTAGPTEWVPLGFVWCQSGTLKAGGGGSHMHLKKISTRCTVLLPQAGQAHPTSTGTPDSPGLLPGVAVSAPVLRNPEEGSASSLSTPSKTCAQKRFQSPVLMGLYFSCFFFRRLFSLCVQPACRYVHSW